MSEGAGAEQKWVMVESGPVTCKAFSLRIDISDLCAECVCEVPERLNLRYTAAGIYLSKRFLLHAKSSAVGLPIGEEDLSDLALKLIKYYHMVLSVPFIHLAV